jgi:tetratricopeptide (TPR) repeat protein
VNRTSPRTLLELLVQQADYTQEEWRDRFAELAAQLGEDATLSTRQLQRWASGQITDARPAARRVAAQLWGHPFASLVAVLPARTEPSGRTPPGQGSAQLGVLDQSTFPDSTGTVRQGPSSLLRPPGSSEYEQALTADTLAEAARSWHRLVRTDNLLGPRHALAGVLRQLGILQRLLPGLYGPARSRSVQLASWYGESAAWLYEDAGELATAIGWTNRAMEWAHEADDDHMIAWSLYRRSQQAATSGDMAQALGLAVAARRKENGLASPLRAAIRVQEACARAASGDDAEPWALFDQAHECAPTDPTGEARDGHGSFCTPAFIELQRASSLLATDQPAKAIELFEQSLPDLDPVYAKNRGAAQARLAIAYAARDEPLQAAAVANQALDVALACGSARIVATLTPLGELLPEHTTMPEVDTLLERLAVTSAQ